MKIRGRLIGPREMAEQPNIVMYTIPLGAPDRHGLAAIAGYWILNPAMTRAQTSSTGLPLLSTGLPTGKRVA
jgi:hypothetical protein